MTATPATADDETNEETTGFPPVPDPAAKIRVVVGGILLPILWLVAGAVVVALLMVLPDHQVRDYAWLIVLVGIVVSALGTYVVVNDVMRPNPTD